VGAYGGSGGRERIELRKRLVGVAVLEQASGTAAWTTGNRNTSSTLR
jgi:hypothetical protein